MSWAYWAPKSTTRTVSNGSGGVTRPPGASWTWPSVTHADALGPLQRLAFGLKGRRHHDLGLLELLDRLVAARGHRRPEGAEQVHPPVVLVGRPDEDFPERAPGVGADPCPSRQGGMECRHPPMAPPPRRFDGSGERRTDHDGVGAAHDGLGDVAPRRHATIGDDLHVHAGLVEVLGAGGAGVGDGGGLWDTDAEHAASGASLSRRDADR